MSIDWVIEQTLTKKASKVQMSWNAPDGLDVTKRHLWAKAWNKIVIDCDFAGIWPKESSDDVANKKAAPKPRKRKATEPIPEAAVAKRTRGSRAKAAVTEADAQPSAFTVTIPAKAPNWLVTHARALSQTDLGIHYQNLVNASMRLEAAFGFFGDKYHAPVSTQSRPAALEKWVAKEGTELPKIKGSKTFATKWVAWWQSLQPDWRVLDSSGRYLKGGDVLYGKDSEWGDLDSPGPEGALTLVAGLAIWGSALKDAPESDLEWLDAVMDVSWMWEGLILSMEKERTRYPNK
ncbi:unnamed protein product [Mycena citricolor]|uniref:Uncharacterized protein n=1 Tax=Mycena citricolor TaxID=2018698 RepID=A0AAD2HN92_9AGAR|nr:unnamed protein product [Mycena citricolor]